MTRSTATRGKQQKEQYPFERFASIRRYTGFDFLQKDNDWILSISDTNGQFNLYRYRYIMNSKGEPECSSYPLTNFVDNSVRRVFSSPTDNGAIFFADYKGNENFQIYKIDDIFNSWPEQITFNPQSRYEWGSECFSHDGRYIAYASNEKNPSDMLIQVKKMKNNNDDSFCITNKEGWYIPGYWSPNNKKLSCSQLVTLTDYSIWILDIENTRMEKMDIGNKEKSRFVVGPWSPDGAGFYILSDLGRDFTGLAFYHVDRSQIEWIHTPPHDIELIDVSQDGKLLLWIENVDGYSKLYMKDLGTQQKSKEIITTLSKNTTATTTAFSAIAGNSRSLSSSPSSSSSSSSFIPLNGVIENLQISPDKKRIGMMMDCPTSPTSVYVIDLDEDEKGKDNSGNCTRIAPSLFGNLDENSLIKPQLIKYKSFDGLEISAFLYMPHDFNNNNNNLDGAEGKDNVKLGAVLSVHGGPTAQERPYYDYAGLYQFLAYNGLAVIAPNFRGSTGYGKKFEKKIYHDWGGDELKDLEYAIKWLLSQDWIDSKRIGVYGASFGGFAALSCITRMPRYNLKAAVDIVGPSNLVTFTKTVPEHWKNFTFELVGNLEKEEAFLKERSPVTFVDDINPKTSLLVIQGENDPRVAKSESDQIVKRIRDNGMDV
ncbi:MAG: prolyl oligopeptidase family serine peptidase, partial [Thermoproteota archaeon]|nr:prolyl oligopeptidase family serine peptidase [Thermoproteota archaeon]